MQISICTLDACVFRSNEKLRFRCEGQSIIRFFSIRKNFASPLTVTMYFVHRPQWPQAIAMIHRTWICPESMETVTVLISSISICKSSLQQKWLGEKSNIIWLIFFVQHTNTRFKNLLAGLEKKNQPMRRQPPMSTYKLCSFFLCWTTFVPVAIPQWIPFGILQAIVYELRFGSRMQTVSFHFQITTESFAPKKHM